MRGSGEQFVRCVFINNNEHGDITIILQCRAASALGYYSNYRLHSTALPRYAIYSAVYRLR